MGVVDGQFARAHYWSIEASDLLTALDDDRAKAFFKISQIALLRLQGQENERLDEEIDVYLKNRPHADFELKTFRDLVHSL